MRPAGGGATSLRHVVLVDSDVPDKVDFSGLSGDRLMAMFGYFNPSGFSSMGVVNSEEWRGAEIPSTNSHGTAAGLARLYVRSSIRESSCPRISWPRRPRRSRRAIALFSTRRRRSDPDSNPRHHGTPSGRPLCASTSGRGRPPRRRSGHSRASRPRRGPRWPGPPPPGRPRRPARVGPTRSRSGPARPALTSTH